MIDPAGIGPYEMAVYLIVALLLVVQGGYDAAGQLSVAWPG